MDVPAVENGSDSDTQNTQHKDLHLPLLEKALSKTVHKCVSSLRFSLLKQHLPAVYARDPVALQKLHEDAVSKLSSSIQEELAIMFEEEGISDLMKRLDTLQRKMDCRSSVAAWRPSGSPREDIHAHLYPLQCKHLQQMQKCLSQLQSQNILLHQMLKTQYDKLLKTHTSIAQKHQEFK